MENATQNGKSVFFFLFFVLNIYQQTAKPAGVCSKQSKTSWSHKVSLSSSVATPLIGCIIDLLTCNLLPPKNYLFEPKERFKNPSGPQKE